MIQRVFAAYQRIATSARRSASLSVTPLEERATPATLQNLLPPIQPPAIVQFVNFTPPLAPTAGDTSVRSDLFGIGSQGAAVHANELEEMLTQAHTVKQTVVSEPMPHLQDKEMAEDVTAAIIVEDTAFLPQAE